METFLFRVHSLRQRFTYAKSSPSPHYSSSPIVDLPSLNDVLIAVTLAGDLGALLGTVKTHPASLSKQGLFTHS